jgi:hypothetical protein
MMAADEAKYNTPLDYENLIKKNVFPPSLPIMCSFRKLSLSLPFFILPSSLQAD